MKNKASAVLKKIKSIMGAIAIAKAKSMSMSMAVKTKFSATKARLLLLSMVKSKKVLMDSLTQKIHQIMSHPDDAEDEDGHDGRHSNAIVLYDPNANANEYRLSSSQLQMQTRAEEEEDDKYPDLRHSLFEEPELEDEYCYEIDDAKLQAAGGSIIGMMRNSKEEGEEFRLEEEIDHAADLFIMRFRKQIRLQKLESFKRLQDMLARAT